jgi:predicted Zn-dependent peptidase
MRNPSRAVAALSLVVGLGAAPAALRAQDREQPPPLGTPKPFRVPPSRSFTLPNGLQVTLVPYGRIPKATVQLAIRTGAIDEPADQVWVSKLAADLLVEGGSRSLGGSALAARIAGMGGQLTADPGDDLVTFDADVLAERTPELVRILADLAQHPAFPASEFPRVSQARARALAVERQQPLTPAVVKFRQLVFGDHPYGRPYPAEGALERLTLEQATQFWRANVGARRAHLYVSGRFDGPATERAIRSAFATWAAGPEPASRPPALAGGRTLDVIDRPNAPQSTLIVGKPVPDPTSPDAIPLDVADGLLGGVFTSRITLNIREDKGYTYSPYSVVGSRVKAGWWTEIADVTTDVTGPSLTEIFKEIDRLRNEAPPADELRGVQNTLAGTYVIRNSNRGGIIGALRFADLHGLGEGYVREYVPRMLSVSPADVQRVARSYLEPEQMHIVVVGDRKVIDPQVAPFGRVTP